QFPGTAFRPSPVSGAKSPAAVSSQGSQLPNAAGLEEGVPRKSLSMKLSQGFQLPMQQDQKKAC
ncbi:unnamed protein product, partial [Ixodes pacificus]